MNVLEICLALLCVVLALSGLLLIQRLKRERRQHAEREQSQYQRLREQAAAEERARIFDDLHDDLGAKLLQLVYEAESAQQADRARALMQDLRDVVTRSRGTPGTLLETLCEIRAKATQRLAAADMGLRWEQPDDLPDLVLAHERTLHLYRIVREAISNAVRHARAHSLRIRIAASDTLLRVELTDDGAFRADGVAGSGKRSMQQRAAQLEGDIAWLPGTEGGTKVLLEVPLDIAMATP
jgi:signal transduction histidine kinase